MWSFIVLLRPGIMLCERFGVEPCNEVSLSAMAYSTIYLPSDAEQNRLLGCLKFGPFMSDGRLSSENTKPVRKETCSKNGLRMCVWVFGGAGRVSTVSGHVVNDILTISSCAYHNHFKCTPMLVRAPLQAKSSNGSGSTSAGLLHT
eukprot:6461988-Amphidinium_carterae.1